MLISDIIFGQSEIKIYETANRVTIDGKFIEGDFWYPRGAAIYKDKIYIADCYHNVIKIYNKEMQYESEFGNEYLSEPAGIYCHEDIIYVCDSDNGIIRKFDTKGKYLSDFGPKTKRPITIAYKNGLFYIVDVNGHCVIVTDKTGKTTLKIDKNIRYPSSIALSEHYIYISSQFTKEIRKYSYNGLYVGNKSEDAYYSKIAISDGVLYCIDGEKNIVIKIELNEVPFNEDEYLKNPLDVKQAAYYIFGKDKVKGIDCFRDLNVWDKKRDDENSEIAELLNEKAYYEFMARFGKNKVKYSQILNDNKYYIELERDIKKVSEDTLEKPKALHITDEFIWVSLFNKKIIAKLSHTGDIISYFSSEIQTEKLVYDGKKVFLIDYFYKKIYELDEETGDMKLVELRGIESPVDIKMINENIAIMDLKTKKIIEFNKSWQKLREFIIVGIEPVGFFIGKMYYVLDKRTGNVYIYNRDGTEHKILENIWDLKYPEDLTVDKDGFIYITDEGNNRIVKISEDGSFVYELGGFSMPKDIVYSNDRLYISNYAADTIKIYKVR